jgi:transcriptional regulator with XRE-family HTH domain
MELGGKLKDLRLKLGLTQEELGDRCDLTKGYISQLESDSCSPAISTLEDILSALGTNLHEFFSENSRQVVFKEEDFFIKEDDKSKIVWLVPDSQSNDMEPITIEISPHTSLDEHSPHEAEEFGYVLTGSVTLHLGEKKYTVKKGESFYFVSDKPHYLENKTDKPASVLWVTSPPSF